MFQTTKVGHFSYQKVTHLKSTLPMTERATSSVPMSLFQFPFLGLRHPRHLHHLPIHHAPIRFLMILYLLLQNLLNLTNRTRHLRYRPPGPPAYPHTSAAISGLLGSMAEQPRR